MLISGETIQQMQSRLSKFEFYSYVSIALVFVGVVGESLPEFHIPKGERAQNVLKRIALGLLILGLAGEFITAVRISGISGALTAQLNADSELEKGKTAELSQQNIQLQLQLESERTARLKIEVLLAPRNLSPHQSEQITRALQPFKGQGILIASAPDDFESAFFAQQLADAAQLAGLKVEIAIGRQMVVGAPRKGIWAQCDKDQEPLLFALAGVLISSKASAQKITEQPVPGTASLQIFVGPKP
jgi:hypothetical protein